MHLPSVYACLEHRHWLKKGSSTSSFTIVGILRRAWGGKVSQATLSNTVKHGSKGVFSYLIPKDWRCELIIEEEGEKSS
ncbi:hypothetical protein Tco_1229718 [Tanacetum coccineum]